MTAASALAAPAPLVVLSETEFSESVLDALRHHAHPDHWRENALLRSRLATLIADGEQDSGEHVALLLLNLSDFKLISDTLGHATGGVIVGAAA